MKKSFLKLPFYALILGSFGFTVLSCNNDDNAKRNNLKEKSITFTNATESKSLVESGFFNGIDNLEGVPHPVILPGSEVSFKFAAANKQYLSFATMYGASKDWFFAPKDTGIKLFDDNGKAIEGDVSDQVFLWDNGSKDNITGAPETKKIQKVDVDASKLLKLTLKYDEKNSEFTLTIKNTSKGTAHETPLSQGVWAVSNFDEEKLINSTPLFKENELTNPEITLIAQEGDYSLLNEKLKNDTGIITNVSKAIVVVYEGDKNPIYEVNALDNGKGLKELSQKGETDELKEYLSSLNNVKHVYETSDGIAPAGSQTIENVEIGKNQNITFVAMFAYSNDWFFSSETPITAFSNGNITNIKIYDSGTGVSQFPGAGNKQALFGGVSDLENEKIREVKEGEYPTLKEGSGYLKVTVK